jgi:type II secretory pathway pseudopilin PulG
MAIQKTKRRSWIKWVLIAVLVVVVVLAGIYWYVATDKFTDTKSRKADYTLNALDFIHEFQQNLKAANEKYSDKIIALNGKVSEVEAADTTVNVKFIDPATSSYAIFAFQQQHLDEAKGLKVGDSISIKGSCSGGIYSEILDVSSISFKRSTLIKKYTN